MIELRLLREGNAIMILKMSAQTILTTLVQPLSGNEASGYEPLSSIWEGSDGDLLEAMFKFYATTPPEPILEATLNAVACHREKPVDLWPWRILHSPSTQQTAAFPKVSWPYHEG